MIVIVSVTANTDHCKLKPKNPNQCVVPSYTFSVKLNLSVMMGLELKKHSMKKNQCVNRALIILGNYGMLVMMNSR